MPETVYRCAVIGYIRIGHISLHRADNISYCVFVRAFHKAVSALRALGKEKTIILSSHILSEISAVCDRVIIINKGKFVAEDTPENLSQKIGVSHKMMFSISGSREQAEEILNSFDGISNVVCVSSENDAYNFEFDTTMDAEERKQLFFAFAEKSMPILTQKELDTSLEDIFIRLTENTAKEENTHESDI